MRHMSQRRICSYTREYDKAVADGEKTKQDLEDMRMEVLSPDYLAFLDSKDNKDEKPPEKTPEELKAEGDAWAKMSPKEIYEKAWVSYIGLFF